MREYVSLQRFIFIGVLLQRCDQSISSMVEPDHSRFVESHNIKHRSPLQAIIISAGVVTNATSQFDFIERVQCL